MAHDNCINHSTLCMYNHILNYTIDDFGKGDSDNEGGVLSCARLYTRVLGSKRGCDIQEGDIKEVKVWQSVSPRTGSMFFLAAC